MHNETYWKSRDDHGGFTRQVALHIRDLLSVPSAGKWPRGHSFPGLTLSLVQALRYGICGPTLADLKENLAIDTNSVSRSVSIMSAGICLGAISSGFLCKLLSKELLAFLLVLVTSLLMGTITFLRSYELFLAWNFLIGVSSGGAISLCESWILAIWGKQCGPYMQALQFFRGLGYIISPILVAPFLLPNEDEVDASGNNLSLFSNSTYPNITLANQTLTEASRYNSKIHTPYILNATMLAIGAIFLLCLYIYQFIRRKSSSNLLAQGVSQIEILSTSNTSICELKRVQAALDEKDGKGDKGEGVPLNQRARYFAFTIVFLSSVFYLFFYEEAIVIFLPTFATNLKVRLSKSQASLLTMAFSLANVIGKGLSVLLAFKVSHVRLLYGNLIIMIGSLTIIILFGNANLPLLWAGICLHGKLSFASKSFLIANRSALICILFWF